MCESRRGCSSSSTTLSSTSEVAAQLGRPNLGLPGCLIWHLDAGAVGAPGGSVAHIVASNILQPGAQSPPTPASVCSRRLRLCRS